MTWVHRKHAMALVVTAAAVTGCGSTVAGQQAGLSQSVQQGDQGLGGTGTATPDGTSGLGSSSTPGGSSSLGSQPGSGGEGGGGSTTLPSGTTPGGTTTQPGGSTQPGTTAPGTTTRDSKGNLQGPGVTPTQVSIGIDYTTDASTGNSGLGAKGITSGDEKGEATAVLKDINNHGGVAGRKLVPVFHQYSATSSDSRETQDERACQDYTRDHKVFAVADSGISLSGVLVTCLAKAGVLQDASAVIINHDEEFFRRYPSFVDIGTLSQDRMMGGLVAALSRQNYLSGWNTATGQPGPATTKIGILSYDVDSWNRPLSSVLLPGLARAGHAVNSKDIYRLTPPDNYGDYGPLVTSIQNAVLRFRQDGVTHVIFLDGNGLLPLFFSKTAGNQHYYPRYGVDSGSGLQALVDGGDIDTRTLQGALGMGWLPNLDLSPARSKHYLGSASAHCLQVMHKNGFTFSDVNAEGIAFGICDKVYALARAINGAAPSVTLPRALDALNKTGEFPSALLRNGYLSADHHAAAEYGYDMEWNSGCNCQKYVGKPRLLR